MNERKQLNVIIADTDDYYRGRLSDLFVNNGHLVRPIINGDELIKNIEEKGGELFILVIDHHLPPIDCFYILNTIKDLGYEGKFPIIVVSDKDEPDYLIREMKASGASAFMTKGLRARKCILPGQPASLLDHQRRGHPEKPEDTGLDSRNIPRGQNKR